MNAATIAFADRGNSPEARALLASLHLDRSRFNDSGIEKLSPGQWDQFVTLAGNQRMRPLLHRRLFETERWKQAPEAAWLRLDRECRAIALRLMRMHSELSAIVTALAQAGVPTMVLKGAYLGPVVYKNIALREMTDLDIMVPRERLKPAAAALLWIGYKELDPFPADWDAPLSHHVTVTRPGAAIVELHWTPTPPNQFASMDPERLWQSAIPLPINGLDAFCLAPEDQLMHLCLHTAFQHQFEFGLRPSCDLQRLIRHHQATLDWDSVIETCERKKWSRGVGLALALAQQMVGADVPAEVSKRLGPVTNGLTAATQLSWVTPGETRSFHPSLAGLGQGGSWAERWRSLRRRLFLTKEELRATHGWTVDRFWWRALHLRRLIVLAQRHGVPAIGIITGVDRRANAVAQQRNAMRCWLTDR